jgi:hypothetical protein
MDDGKVRGTDELLPWDTEWAAEQAAAVLRYLGRNAPEVLENTSVLEPHEEGPPTRRPCRTRDCLPRGLTRPLLGR